MTYYLTRFSTRQGQPPHPAIDHFVPLTEAVAQPRAQPFSEVLNVTKAAEQKSIAIISAMVFYVTVNVGSDVHAVPLPNASPTDPVASLQRSLTYVVISVASV